MGVVGVAVVEAAPIIISYIDFALQMLGRSSPLGGKPFVCEKHFMFDATAGTYRSTQLWPIYRHETKCG